MVKCSHCPNILAPNVFPRKRNLQYLKTCHPCTVKQHSFRQSKHEKAQEEDSESFEEGSSQTPSKRKGPEARDGSEVRMSLSWADFMALVAKHKSDTFEVDAEIDLSNSELLGGDRDAENQVIARDIANKIWKTIGYRFV
jgi:hypothetical protein